MNAPSPFLQRRRRRMKTPKVDDIVDLESESPLHSTPGSSKRSAIDLDDAAFETGESSNSKSNDRILCEFCAAEKTSGEWFPIHGCSHRYCKDCAASRLQENVTAVTPCPAPGCGSGKLSPSSQSRRESEQEKVKSHRQKVSNRQGQVSDILQTLNWGLGRDLQALCEEAAMRPIRELGENILTVEAHQVTPLQYNDFRKSMAVIRASLNKSYWEELLKYNQEFGSN